MLVHLLPLKLGIEFSEGGSKELLLCGLIQISPR